MECVACGKSDAAREHCAEWLCPDLLVKRIAARTQFEPDEAGCWVFTGAKCGSGYGHLALSAGTARKDLMSHRVSYEAFVGRIQPGMDIDHLCGNKACWNPDHLDAVTPGENSSRYHGTKTHCKEGHQLEFIPSKGRRGCSTCRNRSATEATSRRRRLFGVR